MKNRTLRIMARVNKVDPDDGQGGGGGQNDAAAETEAQKIAKAVEAATSALKVTNANLIAEKRALSANQQLIESIGGTEALAQLKEFKSKIEQDEILKLAMEGKPQEAIEKATERLKVTHNAEKIQMQQEAESYKSELTNAQEQLRKLIVDNVITRDFLAVKGVETAVADVLVRAREAFTVEAGVPVARDVDGNLIQGVAGPLTPREWVESLRKTAPHFFPGSVGSNMEHGESGTDNFASSLLNAAKKGPEALRAEKARQKSIIESKKK